MSINIFSTICCFLSQRAVVSAFSVFSCRQKDKFLVFVLCAVYLLQLRMYQVMTCKKFSNIIFGCIRNKIKGEIKLHQGGRREFLTNLLLKNPCLVFLYLCRSPISDNIKKQSYGKKISMRDIHLFKKKTDLHS